MSCVSDRSFDGLTAAQLAELASDEEEITFAFMADADAIHGPEHTLLVVELWDDPGRTFRVAPHEVWSVQANLEIANIDFEEFADAVDHDGVFRGFTDESS
ncbi:hypothetical protein Rhe02_37730 [Rhizocola hellebori]|uniref:DUF6924 domain-containing protein n=1 Tax=Rhizocola hellebori TaxID=1392758 RepID=A0A8J3Q9R0_9ACTN|nr:hypothetical protein [Rhizocola hellebori]GIH05706.1 hypothetical protein Rhe02_37730 [Rhizocola hellebori]